MMRQGSFRSRTFHVNFISIELRDGTLFHGTDGLGELNGLSKLNNPGTWILGRKEHTLPGSRMKCRWSLSARVPRRRKRRQEENSTHKGVLGERTRKHWMLETGEELANGAHDESVMGLRCSWGAHRDSKESPRCKGTRASKKHRFAVVVQHSIRI